MSRNVLKIIAIVSMLIDHIGKLFFPDVAFLAIVGRLAFPLFAFFIAEGVFYTRSIKKYLCKLLIFGLISQIPYILFFYPLIRINVLFTFIFAILLILLINKIRATDNKVDKGFLIFFAVAYTLIIALLGYCSFIEYGVFGMLLPVCFYFFRHKIVLKYVSFVALMVGYVGSNILISWSIEFGHFIQLFALLAIVLIALYNDRKDESSNKLKYLFYVFYPLHLALLVLIKFILGV